MVVDDIVIVNVDLPLLDGLYDLLKFVVVFLVWAVPLSQTVEVLDDVVGGVSNLLLFFEAGHLCLYRL